MLYVDPGSIIVPDGTELVELNIVKPLGDFFSCAKNYATAAHIIQSSVSKGTFTLNANTTSTTVVVSGANPVTSYFAGVPCPLTPHAANDMGISSYAMGIGDFVVTHANNSHIDRTFSYVIFL
jgi:hypothetical protein